MTQPCIIAVFIGIALMIAGSYGFVISSFLDETLKAVASCNTALSMIVVGGILSDVDFRSIFDRDALIYSMIRLVVLPLEIMVILRTLKMDALAGNVCIFLSAMPAASTTAMLAENTMIMHILLPVLSLYRHCFPLLLYL